jgi:hypothetical protein
VVANVSEARVTSTAGFNHDDGGNTFLRNVDNLQDDTAHNPEHRQNLKSQMSIYDWAIDRNISSVSIVSDYRLDDQGSIPGRTRMSRSYTPSASKRLRGV